METSPISNGGIVRVPFANGNVVEVDLRAHYHALTRIEETAYVSDQKAPELCRTFNKAYLEFGKLAALMRREKGRAKSAVKKVEAKIKLTKAEDLLRERNLRSSTDLREAVVHQDPEFLAAQDLYDQIEAMQALFEHNKDSLKQAWLNVYRQWGEKKGPMDDPSRRLDGILPDNTQAGQTVGPTGSFGRAQYRGQ